MAVLGVQSHGRQIYGDVESALRGESRIPVALLLVVTKLLGYQQLQLLGGFLGGVRIRCVTSFALQGRGSLQEDRV